MFILLILAAAALAATPEELAKIRYLSMDGRFDEAARYGATVVAADPGDASSHITWIQARLRGAPHAGPRLRAIYEGWLAEAPDDPVRRVALAWATALATPGAQPASLPSKPGPWCDEVLGLLEPPPEPTPVRARAVWLQRLTLERCGRDDAEARAALLTLAETEDRVRHAAVVLRLSDGVDEDDARAVAALLDAEPSRANVLRSLWAEQASGPGLQAARAAALDKADELSQGDDPVLVSAAYAVYRAAGQAEDAEACRERMKTLDPGHFMPRWGEAEAGAPKKAALGSLAERLAALDAQGTKGMNPWQKGAWHSERARLLEDLGRGDEVLGGCRALAPVARRAHVIPSTSAHRSLGSPSSLFT